MNKRGKSKKAVAIGTERMERLAFLSIDAVKNDRPRYAQRYVDLAKRIGMRTKAKMPHGFRYCKGCMMPLVPGWTCTVRLTKGKVVSRCSGCNKVWRMPYLKERKQ